MKGENCVSESKYYSQNDPVAITPLREYTEDGARAAMKTLLDSIGALDSVKEGMRVVIKANLVSARKADEAVTVVGTVNNAVSVHAKNIVCGGACGIRTPIFFEESSF